MSLTGNELDEVIKENDLIWEDLEDVLYSKSTELPQGTLTFVDQFGGEGQGDTYWIIVKLTEPDGTETFYRRNGWYQSHYGYELDGPTDIVEQAEKVITVWVTPGDNK